MIDVVENSAPAIDLQVLVDRIDARLAALVPSSSEPPQKLHKAIRYSLLAPGKRLRPLLTLLSARAFGGCDELAVDPACALEMAHAASLIVDDLPFMDDAQERRGLPANHLAFGLATANLASLALLNRAFSVLSTAPGLSPETRVAMVASLSAALGDSGGAIAGQEEDIEAPDGTEMSVLALEAMVRHKTAALFEAAVELGAWVAGADAEQRAAARDFGREFGLCFQALDDLADRYDPKSGEGAEQDSRAKHTFVSVLGVERTRLMAESYGNAAVTRLEAAGVRDPALVDMVSNLLTEIDSSPVSSSNGS